MCTYLHHLSYCFSVWVLFVKRLLMSCLVCRHFLTWQSDAKSYAHHAGHSNVRCLCLSCERSVLLTEHMSTATGASQVTQQTTVIFLLFTIPQTAMQDRNSIYLCLRFACALYMAGMMAWVLSGSVESRMYLPSVGLCVCVCVEMCLCVEVRACM